MAFIRNRFLLAVLLFCFYTVKAQTVYYPAQSSQLLKTTAEDMATLLQRSIAGSHFNTQPYTNIPASGIVLLYDSTIKDNQACRVKVYGENNLRFSAAEDNGLCFGVYQYLQQCGFRFYQPGSIWELIPALPSAYRDIDTVFTTPYRYKTWFISGGHSRWAMDNNTAYSWEPYAGDLGHNWALYQRRNGMLGAYRFTGHRGDVMTGTYMATLVNNPCYVANYEGSREATNRSVPDINNNSGMQLWGNTIQQKFTQYRNNIFSNPALYANLYRNFGYYNGLIGIEVPDGAQWGNVKDNNGCTGNGYPKETDQHILLSNYTARQISTLYPDKRFQVYAYSAHANIPSAGITIDPKIDVQVIATAFQSESSPKGLFNRWYNTTSNISEYHYLNIPQWGGETPMFYKEDLVTTLARTKEKKSQGIVWEASPAKFASLPFLLAANSNLKDNAAVDSVIHDFCKNMFADAAETIYRLIQYWGDDRTITVSTFMNDNKYKLPLYFSLVNEARQQARNAPEVVQERLRELKAYLHYMVLYYDWAFDQRGYTDKTAKAAAICLYLAKVSRMQLVNSYFLITNMVSKYPADFKTIYNAANGTAYQNGALPQVTAADIDRDFQSDYNTQVALIGKYKLETDDEVAGKFTANGLAPLQKITVKMGYTNGANYPNRSEFFIEVPAAGAFTIAYTPRFEMAGKGYINFTVEADEKALGIIKDLSIENPSAAGSFTVNLPSAGRYMLSVVSKFKSSLDLEINTQGNLFYKKGPFLGNKTENYRNDLKSLPGYFYVPAGLDRVVFSVNNAKINTGYATPEAIGRSFGFRDNKGNAVQPKLVSPSDPSLFYLEVSNGSSGSFWQATQMEQYNLCFANISNLQWYATAQGCSNAGFTIEVVKKNGACITRLKANTSSATGLQWDIADGNRSYHYNNVTQVDLPENVGATSLVTLKNGSNCSLTKRLSTDAGFLKAKEACAGAGSVPVFVPAGLASVRTAVYPNPSTGIYYCQQNGENLVADQVSILNAEGAVMANFAGTRQFDISKLAAGIYLYRMRINGEQFSGKLVKL